MNARQPSRILPYGPRAVLAEFGNSASSVDITGWAAAAARLDGVEEVVPGARTVLVRGEHSSTALEDVEARSDDGGQADDAVVDIAVRYDGADLPAVAEATGMTVEDAIAAHSAPTYRCAFCGFAPGFSYLEGLDERLILPRRQTPRTRVPAGSVAIAAGYTAVYPQASPGGWLLLGHTEAVMFDLSRDRPALLPPGAQVRFVRR